METEKQYLKVNWNLLMLNHPPFRFKDYPSPNDIRGLVKNIPEDWETCCIQMSYALNKSGAKIENTGHNVGFTQKGDNYIIAVPTMRKYLSSKYKVENYVAPTRIAKIAQIVDRTGIIAFGDRHIDLWNKTNIHRPDYYILSALWEHETTIKKGIFFWDVPFEFGIPEYR